MLVARALLAWPRWRSQGELERALALNEETLACRAQQDLSSTVITLSNLTMTAVGTAGSSRTAT